MDVYQKLLIKLYEKANGKDTENVDFTDLVKREGFYPSLPSILEHFLSQIWITQASGKNVRLTHWGIQEAKKLRSDSTFPGIAKTQNKDVNLLISDSKELTLLIEDFAKDSTGENFNLAAKKISEMNAAIERIKTTIR